MVDKFIVLVFFHIKMAQNDCLTLKVGYSFCWYCRPANSLSIIYIYLSELRKHTGILKIVTDLINTIEPSRGKTNNAVSEQVRHKQGCTVAEDG